MSWECSISVHVYLLHSFWQLHNIPWYVGTIISLNPVPGFFLKSQVKQKIKKKKTNCNEYSILSFLALHTLLLFVSLYTYQVVSVRYHYACLPSRTLVPGLRAACTDHTARLWLMSCTVGAGGSAGAFQGLPWDKREASGCLQTPQSPSVRASVLCSIFHIGDTLVGNC